MNNQKKFLTDNISNYQKYRGKCKEYAEKLCKEDPNLILVRGYYYCPFWGKQGHWWCKKPDGTIVDPTVKQFPSKGTGVYEEFDGWVECAECGTRIKEEQAQFEGSYAFCSTRCHLIFVGLEELL
jgi:hypothetical protein